jgi:hypothetical protein
LLKQRISEVTIFGLRIARAGDHTVPKMAGSIRIPHSGAASHEVVRGKSGIIIILVTLHNCG